MNTENCIIKRHCKIIVQNVYYTYIKNAIGLCLCPIPQTIKQKYISTGSIYFYSINKYEIEEYKGHHVLQNI